jgi:hypothetical protein
MTAILTTPVGFNFTDGSSPRDSLLLDANGDLFGTTGGGGAGDAGTAFEITKTASGYASVPTTLVSFSGDDGADPAAGLIADASGDLFGTTSAGANGDGTVFEIKKTAAGYASASTTRSDHTGQLRRRRRQRSRGEPDRRPERRPFWDNGIRRPERYRHGVRDQEDSRWLRQRTHQAGQFQQQRRRIPQGNLVADANGDLLGMTNDSGPGATDVGTVFEIAKTPAGYASTPTTLVGFFSFDVGGFPEGGLIADANGDLFGTTDDGGPVESGAGDRGTVFEIKRPPPVTPARRPYWPALMVPTACFRWPAY